MKSFHEISKSATQQLGKPHSSETCESGLRQSDSLESETESNFDGLTDRQRLIGALLNRLQSQRFQPALEGDALLLKIWDFEPVLSDIPIWALDHCFVEAMKLHRSEFPIQVNEISRIWLEMGEETKARLYAKHARPALPASSEPCEWCEGRGLMRVAVQVMKNADPETRTPAMTKRIPVKWNDSIDTNAMDICHCRRAA
jgi:hypothetical protein